MRKISKHDAGPLERLFGVTATARILDFITVFRDWDYSKQDIAKNSNVSSRHAYKAIDKLEKLELIKKTRTIGKAQLYKFNIENKSAHLLQEFGLELACQEAQKIADAEIAKEEQTKQQATPHGTGLIDGLKQGQKAETVPA